MKMILAVLAMMSAVPTFAASIYMRCTETTALGDSYKRIDFYHESLQDSDSPSELLYANLFEVEGSGPYSIVSNMPCTFREVDRSGFDCAAQTANGLYEFTHDHGSSFGTLRYTGSLGSANWDFNCNFAHAQ